MNSLKTENYIVAYLDLLGARRKMITDEKCDYLQAIHECMTSCKRKVDDFESELGMGLTISIFSDNIVIAVKNENPNSLKYGESFFSQLCCLVGVFQRWFLERKQLLRGGVTQGKFFINENFVYGEALVRAYEIENMIAIYPRVVIDSKLGNLVREYIDFDTCGWLDTITLTRDFDGELFLDYLNYPTNDSIVEQQKNAIKDIELLIKEANGDDKALQKINWHRNYLKHY